MDNLAPAISPPSGIGDSKPTNQAVLDWVQEVARLTEPENIFWCDGSEKENAYLLERSAAAGRGPQTERGKKARLVSASLEPERRGAGRAIHLHLHADEGGSRPDQQLGRAGRDLHKTPRHAHGRDARADDVCRALHHGPAGFAADQGRLRNHRLDLRRPQHADHDADGDRRGASAWAIDPKANGIAACIRCSM